MPLFFGVLGIVLIVCAINNTLSNGTDGLIDLVRGDFTGPNNFLVWIIAILIAGAFGYVPRFKPVSIAFLGLIFLVIILSNQKSDGSGGAFVNLFNAFLHPDAGLPGSSLQVTGSGGEKKGGGISTGDMVKAAEIAVQFI